VARADVDAIDARGAPVEDVDIVPETTVTYTRRPSDTAT
jgi:hypothetical protein